MRCQFGCHADVAYARTYIFPNDLLQCMCENFPWKYFHVLLDIPRLRVGKIHDNLEKILAVRLSFRDCGRSETFEVAADPIFLLHRKSYGDQ